jgi:hypothetical protein
MELVNSSKRDSHKSEFLENFQGKKERASFRRMNVNVLFKSKSINLFVNWLIDLLFDLMVSPCSLRVHVTGSSLVNGRLQGCHFGWAFFFLPPSRNFSK